MSDDASVEVPLEEACVLPHPERTRRKYGLTCHRHYHWLGNTLNEMVELYALLPETILPGPGGDGRAATKVDGPAPMRLEIVALTESVERGGSRGEAHGGGRDREEVLWDEEPDIDRIIPALASWVATVHEELGITEPDWVPTKSLAPACERQCQHGTCVYVRSAGRTSLKSGDFTFHSGRWRIRESLVELAHILKRERSYIVEQDWVDEYAAQLTLLHRQLATAAGETMWPRSIGRCPNCQTSLFNTIGVDEVECRKCRSVWRGVHLARLMLIHEQDNERRKREQLQERQANRADQISA